MANLNSIFDKPKTADVKSSHPRRVVQWIHYTKLFRSAYQFYGEVDEEIKELAYLIALDGEVLQNLRVRKIDVDEYEIIAGHKRTLACKYLVEIEHKEEFGFLPCEIKDLDDIRARFQTMSSNYHHPKTPFETMKEIEDMKYLLETYPDEFAGTGLQGKMVDRLAKTMHINRTTITEYQNISHNLIGEGRELMEKGELKFQAANVLAGLPCADQKKLISKNILSRKEIVAYKRDVLEPSQEELLDFYEKVIKAKGYDLQPDLKKTLVTQLGKVKATEKLDGLSYLASPKEVTINGKTISWIRLVNNIKKAQTNQSNMEPLDAIDAQLSLGTPDSTDAMERFLDEFRTWGIWMSNTITEEEFYRKCLPDGSAVVVHTYYVNNGEFCQATDYYLLPPSYRHFRDCKTDKSFIIMHLMKETKKGD